MDKKNTLIGLICIVAGIAFMFWQAKELEQQRMREAAEAPAQESVEPGRMTPPGVEDAAMQAPVEGVEPASSADPDAMLGLLARDVDDESLVEDLARATPREEERTIRLANEFIEVSFTNRGGAIQKVEFLQTRGGERDDFVFNQAGLLPALSLSLSAPDGGMREFALEYAVESQSDNQITFVFDTGDGLRIRRSYELAAPGETQDPYIIRHSTTFENSAVSSKALSTIYLNLGTARPISSNTQATYLNVGRFNGDKARFTAVNRLTGSGGFLGIGARSPQERIQFGERMEWTSVKNQFFAAVLSSDQHASELVVQAAEPLLVESGKRMGHGITGSVGYAVGTVVAGGSKTLEMEYYVGPKEFKRLQSLGNQQDLVMQFGFLSFISKLLLSFMYAIYFVVPSWGWSIVIMTICIKLLFWPLTAKAGRSQKRMAKIQGPMKELKEKYKDNPQKMQQETLKLFKEHQVNPVAGCLPILVQMPIFLGLFYMLRTASELRHESFLWVRDLSQSDTIFEIGGFPINLLPVIMGLTMYFQMRMMPVSPTADPMQQKIFKFLPAVFLVFLYNFSSGLVLYWTVQNLLTILQQKLINNQPDEPLPGVSAEGKPGTSGKSGSGGAKAKARPKPRKKK